MMVDIEDTIEQYWSRWATMKFVRPAVKRRICGPLREILLSAWLVTYPLISHMERYPPCLDGNENGLRAHSDCSKLMLCK